jgi:hypothetical protein
MTHLAEVGGGWDSSVRSGGGVGVGVADQQAGSQL